MQEFIRTRGITLCPARTAHGTDWRKPTAYGSSHEETSWMTAHKTPEKCNEENLAKAKILTMLQDLGGKVMGCYRGEKAKVRQEAWRFFFDPKERSELEAWCDTAGYELDFVQEKAKAVHENGLPQWRAKAGEGKRYTQLKNLRDKKKALRQ